MTRIFKPDPVMVQKDCVRAALRAWQETRRAVNDPDAVPQRLDAIIKVVWTVTKTIGPEIVTHIDAVVVELEELPFSVEDNEPLFGLEKTTRALQGALGALKRTAINEGYEVRESKSLPRIPRAVVVDELEVIRRKLDTLSAEIKQIKEQQGNELESNLPPGQAPIVNKFVEKVEVNIKIMFVKIDGHLIDIENLSNLTGNISFLFVSLADAVSQLGPRVSKWLVYAAKEKFRSTAITFDDLGRGLVTTAQIWIMPPGTEKEETHWLSWTQPPESLADELREVAGDARALQEVLRRSSGLPGDFPAQQLDELLTGLQALVDGTAEGCREPLTYARARLPQIRREYILTETRSAGAKIEGDQVPPLMRGETIDKALSALMTSVSVALDEYRRLSGES